MLIIRVTPKSRIRGQGAFFLLRVTSPGLSGITTLGLTTIGHTSNSFNYMKTPFNHTSTPIVHNINLIHSYE